METASLTTLSPNKIEFKFLYLFYEITVNTVTVSVEHRTDASSKHSVGAIGIFL